jgi:hypothetical protein
VNWLTISTSPVVSATERFMTPSSSGITRKFQIRSASFSAVASVSVWVAPTSTHSPRPMLPTTSPATVTCALATRCTSPRTAR